MSCSRRKFLREVLGTAFLLSAGPLSSWSAAVPDRLFFSKRIILRFAVASDGHYGQSGTAFALYHDELVQWLNQENMGKGLDFCILNGDIIHDDPKYLPMAKEKFDFLHTPYYVGKGNHDQVDEARWTAFWGMPANYSFTRLNCAFIVANTSDEAGHYLCPDLQWMEAQLKKYREEKHVFLFLHITPNKWTKNGVECDALLKMLGRYKNVRAIFNGHDHDQDNVKWYGKKPFFFDGHFGGNWGTEYRGYRIVEVWQDHHIFTYQVNPVTGALVNSYEG